jgi:NADPH:quinone reductase-like Zn-dependent oxidoreductase
MDSQKEIAMKAAVIRAFGDIPQYEDFPDPVVDGEDALIQVRAVVLENFDKITAAGTHYASKHLFPLLPAIVGHSGVGALADGTLVTFGGVRPPYGTMAEKAVVPGEYRAFISRVPPGVDASVAAALPAAALTTLLPLRYGVRLQSSESVLIHGATGVSGKIAVQVAKLLGAGRIVATGRDRGGLQELTRLGADSVIDLKQSDEEVAGAYRQDAAAGIDVILDFLWGPPTELLLKALVPKTVGFASHRTRFIQAGEAASPTISLSAATLRTSGLEMMGGGNIPPAVVPEALQQVWEWIKDNQVHIDIVNVPLRDVSTAWGQKTEGKRIVLIP